jgi:predicted nuclease of predicted toxin-antitoxin system
MKSICDVHIPYKLVKFLNEQGIETVHVNSLPQGSLTKDNHIALFADENQMVVITKDEDFERLHFTKNRPKKLIRIVLGNVSTNDLIHLFEKHHATILDLYKLPQYYLQIGKNGLVLIKDYES